jgi:predicted signal transduction protein with EAL and GGDEF domain
LRSHLKAAAVSRVVADKVVHALAAELRVGARKARLKASIGVSLFPADGGDGEALLRSADAARYRTRQLRR